jgi:hypothetical protein
MRPPSKSRMAHVPSRAEERATWLRTHWDALTAQAVAYYQKSQVERFLEELAVREGHTFARAVPDYRHFGTPEYALHLSWDHQRVAWVQVAKGIEIYMGYAGTLLIVGKRVTVLLRQQWQQDRSLVQQALERAYQVPQVETRLDEAAR